LLCGIEGHVCRVIIRDDHAQRFFQLFPCDRAGGINVLRALNSVAAPSKSPFSRNFNLA